MSKATNHPTAAIIIPQKGQTDLTRQLLRQMQEREPSLRPTQPKPPATETATATLSGLTPPVDTAKSPSTTVFILNDDAGNPIVPLDSADPLNGCTIVQNRGVGVTAAWNHGIERAIETHPTIEHLMLLNNDVICRGPFVERLIAATHGGISGAGLRHDSHLSRMVLEGWCLCFSVELWRELDGFDESMKLYFSDTDFLIRAIFKGKPCTCATDLPLQHLQHRTAHSRDCASQARRQHEHDRRAFTAKMKRINAKAVL